MSSQQTAQLLEILLLKQEILQRGQDVSLFYDKNKCKLAVQTNIVDSL